MRHDTLTPEERELVAGGLSSFVDRHGSATGEILWRAALAMIEEAARARLETAGSRWSHGLARTELRRLRHELARGLQVAHLAATLESSYFELWSARERPARERRELEQAEARRQSAMQGVWAKRAHRAARADGRERATPAEVRASIAEGLLEEARRAGERAR